LFYPKIFLSKRLRYIYLFVGIYLIFIPLIWNSPVGRMGNSINYGWLQKEMQPVFIAVLIYTYFIAVGDYKGLAWVVVSAFIFFGITSITSIVGLNQYPLAARDIAGALSARGLSKLLDFYSKKGIASYGFFNGLAFLFPVMVFQLKKLWDTRILKFIFIGMMLIFFYAIIKAQFTSALLLSIFYSIAAILIRKNQKRSVTLYLILGVFLIVIPTEDIANIFFSSSGLFKDTILEERITDIGKTIENPEVSFRSEQHASRRLARIPLLLESFAKDPLLGGGENTGHVFWFDRLSMFGLIGFIPWILFLKNQIQSNLRLFNDDFKPYYILSMAAFVSLGFIKNMGGDQMASIVFIFIPGIYFLKYLKEPRVFVKAKNTKIV
jgi:hypothetical protein